MLHAVPTGAVLCTVHFNAAPFLSPHFFLSQRVLTHVRRVLDLRHPAHERSATNLRPRLEKRREPRLGYREYRQDVGEVAKTWGCSLFMVTWDESSSQTFLHLAPVRGALCIVQVPSHGCLVWVAEGNIEAMSHSIVCLLSWDILDP